MARSPKLPQAATIPESWILVGQSGTGLAGNWNLNPVHGQDKLRSRLINAARFGRSFSLTASNFNPSPPPGFT